MVLSNFRFCFESLYKEIGLEVVNYGSIFVTYANSNIPEFNMIFDTDINLDDMSNYNSNLNKALIFATTKNKPFFFIQENIQNSYSSDLLPEYNFSKVAIDVSCMIYHHNKNCFVEEDQNYSVKKVSNNIMLEEYCEILSEAFEVPLNEIKKVFFSSYFLSAKAVHTLYILYKKDNLPVAVSMLYLPEDKDKAAGHYCWGTKRNFRNKGAMSFLAKRMIYIAQDKGYKDSVGQCHNTSIGLAQRIGFLKKGYLNYYLNTLSKTA